MRNRGEFEPHLGDDYLGDSERSESENVQFDERFSVKELWRLASINYDGNDDNKQINNNMSDRPIFLL